MAECVLIFIVAFWVPIILLLLAEVQIILIYLWSGLGVGLFLLFIFLVVRGDITFGGYASDVRMEMDRRFPPPPRRPPPEE